MDKSAERILRKGVVLSGLDRYPVKTTGRTDGRS